MHHFDLHTRCSSVVCALFFFGALGCGYSTQEYDQQVRRSSMLHQKLVLERQTRKSCETRFAAAKEDADTLRQSLAEQGLNDRGLGASLEQHKQALDEYSVRGRQLESFRTSFRALRRRLPSIGHAGVQAEVVDNRLTIQLPSEALFDPGADAVSKRGHAVLQRVAEVLRGGSEWAKRNFQVAVPVSSERAKPRETKDLWAFSVLRAKSVVVFLAKPLELGGGGLNGARLSAAGYVDPETIPTDPSGGMSSGTERVEIIVQPNRSEMLNLGGLAD
jgi:flagellar motor protein MotB